MYANIWTEIIYHVGTNVRAPAWDVYLYRKDGSKATELIDNVRTYGFRAAEALGAAMLKAAHRDEDQHQAELAERDALERESHY